MLSTKIDAVPPGVKKGLDSKRCMIKDCPLCLVGGKQNGAIQTQCGTAAVSQEELRGWGCLLLPFPRLCAASCFGMPPPRGNPEPGGAVLCPLQPGGMCCGHALCAGMGHSLQAVPLSSFAASSSVISSDAYTGTALEPLPLSCRLSSRCCETPTALPDCTQGQTSA